MPLFGQMSSNEGICTTLRFFPTEVCFEANILNMFFWEIVFVKVKDPRYQYVSMLQYAIDTDMLPGVQHCGGGIDVSNLFTWNHTGMPLIFLNLGSWHNTSASSPYLGAWCSWWAPKKVDGDHHVATSPSLGIQQNQHSSRLGSNRQKERPFENQGIPKHGVLLKEVLH